MDISNGEYADIVLWNNDIDMESYISKNLFTDLKPLFKDDKDISEDQYLDNIMELCKVNERINYLMMDFSVSSLVYDKSEWDEIRSFTFEDLFQFSNDHPNNHIFYNFKYDELAELLIIKNISEFVDIQNRTCHFDNELFINLLEFILRDGVEEKVTTNNTEMHRTKIDRFKNDNCFLDVLNVNKIDYINLKDIVSDEGVGLFGFPSENGNNTMVSSDNIIGITDKSNNKIYAWNFIKYMLSDKYQLSICDNKIEKFPVIENAFEIARQETYDDNNNLDKKTVDVIFDFACNSAKPRKTVTQIADVIRQQISLFTNNEQTAEETAQNLQAKINIYLKEIE